MKNSNTGILMKNNPNVNGIMAALRKGMLDGNADL